MILQTSLWQFVKFTFTDLGPAFANWARNWYWSPHRKIPNCDSPDMKGSPIVHMKMQTPHWHWKMNLPFSWGERIPWFSSHIEGFIFAIQEEEIYTNHLAAKRDKGNNKSAKYRLWEAKNETIHHRIACFPKLSPSMYLPVRQ